MTRIFLNYILPLALPTLIYLIWAAMAARRGDEDAKPLSDGPWFKLAVAGFVLMLAALAAAAITGGMGPDGEYRAPYVKDGNIVPGHMEPNK